MGDHYFPGLWERVMEDPDNSFSQQGLIPAMFQLLQDNEAAVIVENYHTLYQLGVESGFCNWGFLRDRFFRANWAFPFPKGSPFLSIFSET